MIKQLGPDSGIFAQKSKVFTPVMLEHIRGGMVLYVVGESPMKVSSLHTQRKDDGQHWFKVEFRF